MTPFPVPSDACLAAEFGTLLALPSVAFGRPVHAPTVTLAFRTCSHLDTRATNSINAGTINLSQSGYIVQLIPTRLSDACRGDGLTTMEHGRDGQGPPFQPTCIILVRNYSKWRRRTHHDYLSTCISARLTMTATRNEATTNEDDDCRSNMTMTDKDDIFARKFSCSNPAASSSDQLRPS